MTDQYKRPWSEREVPERPAEWTPGWTSGAQDTHEVRASTQPESKKPAVVGPNRLRIVIPVVVLGCLAVGGGLFLNSGKSTSAVKTSVPEVVTSPSTVASDVVASTARVSTTAAAAPATTIKAAQATTAAVATTKAPATTVAPATTPTPPANTPITFDGAPSEKLPGGQPWPNGFFIDGKMHLRGAVPSRAVADGVFNKAVAILGQGNVIDEMVIEPTAALVKTALVRLGDPILFEPNSAVMKPESFARFDLWAAFMKQNPSITLAVIGYTDDRGSIEANNDLALRRATASMNRIVSNGIDPSRLSAMSRGTEDPIADNATDEGRALNRRIEISVTGLFG